jgi:hypothetical protein
VLANDVLGATDDGLDLRPADVDPDRELAHAFA